MVNVYDLDQQQSSLDAKIFIALENIFEAYKSLLWRTSEKLNLSPTQIRTVLFIKYHDIEMATVGYLSKEFNVSKATMSDTVKTLIKKDLLYKVTDKNDARRFRLHLTKKGEQLSYDLNDYAAPLARSVAKMDVTYKEVVFDGLMNVVEKLQKTEVTSKSRMCKNCAMFRYSDIRSFCMQYHKPMQKEELRMDCPDFKLAT
ncbi:hypothetical protein GCM10009117_20780 [Gangjinia marincola]|uniref:HTH marR-type domain-containing protein n=1 Tax=Gangjinia marincola TaxID=578463 RepID=A0ABP3XY56_9FLAO